MEPPSDGYQSDVKPIARLLTGLAVAGGALVSLRFAFSVAADVRRYDRMRAMSGDGPLAAEMPEMVGRIVESERKSLPGLLPTILGLPSDALRYARMKLM